MADFAANFDTMPPLDRDALVGAIAECLTARALGGSRATVQAAIGPIAEPGMVTRGLSELGITTAWLPAAAIGEIHLAGHAVHALPGGGQVAIDDHGSAVSDTVWQMYDATIRHVGPRPTLIEWDTAIPAFAVLAQEAAKADAVLFGEVRHAAAG